MATRSVVAWTIACLAAACSTAEDAAAQALAAGPAIAGVGGAYAALDRDHYGLANPASAAVSRRFGVSFAVSRSFGLSELDHVSSSVAYRAGRLAGVAVLEAFGFRDFGQVTGHLVLAGAATSPAMRLGVRITARQLRITDYGSRGQLTASAGVLLSLSRTVDAGLAVENAVNSDGEASDMLRRMVVGVRFRLPGSVLIYADLAREDLFAPAVHAGLELTVLGTLALRSGLSTAPSAISFGLGARRRDVEASVASQRHQPLGWSRSVGFSMGR